MAIRLGDEAPNFTAETTEGSVDLYDYLGDGWGMLFSHPKDFTPVCTTELGAFAKRKSEFDQRNVKLIGVSVDPLDSHQGWAKDIAETQGAELNFPLIADPDRKVADLYDMIHPNANDTMTVRSVFIIGPDKKVKLMITYPASTGRNVDELLRVIDSLQLTAGYQVATPVNWQDGDDVIITAAVSDEDAKDKFPKGWKAPKPYLRITPQPNKYARSSIVGVLRLAGLALETGSQLFDGCCQPSAQLGHTTCQRLGEIAIREFDHDTVLLGADRRHASDRSLGHLVRRSLR